MQLEKPVVVHTDGNQGLDFKFKKGSTVGVFLTFESKLKLDFIKRERKWKRNVFQSMNITFILIKDIKLNKKSITSFERL